MSDRDFWVGWATACAIVALFAGGMRLRDWINERHQRPAPRKTHWIRCSLCLVFIEVPITTERCDCGECAVHAREQAAYFRWLAERERHPR